jgi:hypothetical protein
MCSRAGIRQRTTANADDALSVQEGFRLFSGGEKIGSQKNLDQNCRAIIGG